MRKILIILIGLAVCACHYLDPVKLVTNGKSEYTILTATTNSKQEKRAAELLQKYIEQISGCKLPIVSKPKNSEKVIFIKETIGFKYDGFRIRTENSGAISIEGSNKGCIYGAIAILDKFMGCHLYSPHFKIIPSRRSIAFPIINMADSSLNSYRIINSVPAFSDDQDLLDWNRLSSINQMFGNGFYVHTMCNELVPSAKYFKSHPEYFAFRFGKRNPSQLCLTNNDVLGLTILKLREAMALEPDKLYWSVSQNDGSLPNYCECEKCKKINDEEKSPSGSIIRFVNEVAKEFPDKVISTLAYRYSRPAPAITKPAGNVQIMLCSIEAFRGNSIESDTSARTKLFLKDLTDWGKIAKHIFVWDYTVNFNYHIAPFPNIQVLQPNIQLFVKNNVEEHFQQMNLAYGHALGELKFYLISRLLWNPNIDVSVTIDLFLKDYFGNAAPWIRKYIDQMQRELIKSGDQLYIYTPPFAYRNSFLSQKNIEDYTNYFDKAEGEVIDNKVYLQHVKVARLSLSFAQMEIAKADLFGSRGWYNADGKERDKMMDGLFTNFRKVCESEKNLGEFKEGGFGYKEYCEMTNFATNVAVNGNLAFRKKVTSIPNPTPGEFSKPDLQRLTDGVKADWDDINKLRWVGWEATDFEITIDLDKPQRASTIELATLWNLRGRTMHPKSLECFVSEGDNKNFTSVGLQELKGDQLKEDIRKSYTFKINPFTPAFRYLKLKIKVNTHIPSTYFIKAGQTSSVFIDEIIIK